MKRSSSAVRSNVARVREGIAAWNSREWQTTLDYFDREIEWHTSGAIPGLDDVYYGHAGVTRFWRTWVETWEDIRIDIEELLERGDDVFVLARFRARGRDGLEVDQPVGLRFTSSRETELVTRVQAYWSRSDMPMDARMSERRHR